MERIPLHTKVEKDRERGGENVRTKRTTQGTYPHIQV
jgi:hypothetical protein